MHQLNLAVLYAPFVRWIPHALLRERVWREVVHEVQWEAANPGRVAKRRGPTGDAAVDTTDQAYLRAYIDVDSKRLKR